MDRARKQALIEKSDEHDLKDSAHAGFINRTLSRRQLANLQQLLWMFGSFDTVSGVQSLRTRRLQSLTYMQLNNAKSSRDQWGLHSLCMYM
jgi:hypothetical protein